MNGPDSFQPQPIIKPKDPDTYEFSDKQLENDYRTMFVKYQEMEALLKEHPEMETVSNNYTEAMAETLQKDGK